MNLLFAALVVISLVGVKFSRFHEDYIGTSQTTAIKGILAVLYLDGRLVPYSICTAVFCLLVVWITMKVRFVNPVLLWLGRQSFSIYILQRIPMIVLTHMGLADNKYLFAALAIVITCLMSAAFTKLLGVVDGYLFRKKASK